MSQDPFLQAAQQEKVDFQLDLQDYVQDYDRLLKARAFHPIQNWMNRPITEQTIAECLHFYYGEAPIALLLYFYVEDELRSWILTTKGIQGVHTQPLEMERLEALELELKKSLKLGSQTLHRAPKKRGTFITSIQQLSEPRDREEIIQEVSDILFPPEQVQILQEQKIEHLIILPALNIQQIPLAILTPFQNDQCLLDVWSYSMAPSIFDVADLVLRKKEKSLSFLPKETLAKGSLLVGNPSFSSESSWELPPLPGAEQEVKLLSETVDLPQESLLIGDEALKNHILEKAGDALILYFATHGVADPEDPLDGCGLFFTPDEQDPMGFWTCREIQHSKLMASLVILSACQTGLGAPQDAGVIGIFRAFHKAGAENIIMSLWSVDDTATQELMQLFMEKIQEPHTFFPCEPLRQAMLEYRKKRPEPIFWAPFSAFGVPD